VTVGEVIVAIQCIATATDLYPSFVAAEAFEMKNESEKLVSGDSKNQARPNLAAHLLFAVVPLVFIARLKASFEEVHLKSLVSPPADRKGWLLHQTSYYFRRTRSVSERRRIHL